MAHPRSQVLDAAADSATMARSFAQQLRSIGAQLSDGRIDHPQSQRALSAVLRERFRCARISYWTLHGQPGQRQARCVFSDGNETAACSLGDVVEETDCSDYFAAL